jgi:serine/threonine protein kinase
MTLHLQIHRPPKLASARIRLETRKLLAVLVPVMLASFFRRPRLFSFLRNLWRRSTAHLTLAGGGCASPKSALQMSEMPAADPFVRLPDGAAGFQQLFEVMDRITDSTFGCVFECRRRPALSETLERSETRVVKIVARKEHPLLQGADGPHEETDAFWRYMSRLLSLRHPNIVRYLEFFTDSTSFYFVMERCPGRTLLEHLLGKASWDERSVRPFMCQLLQALGYIHSLGIIHRDVKLENLMVFRPDREADEQLQLLDFGLGCEAVAACGAIGTIGYMAPEVFCPEPYGRRADIFSAGVVMHILLTGRPAFRPPRTFRDIEKHRCAMCQALDFREAPLCFVTRHGCTLLERMLSPNPAARCTADQALEQFWFDDQRNGQQSNPVLWNSSSSEIHFLKVIGSWSGSCSDVNRSNSLSRKVLKPIQETDGKIEEARGALRHMMKAAEMPQRRTSCVW